MSLPASAEGDSGNLGDVDLVLPFLIVVRLRHAATCDLALLKHLSKVQALIVEFALNCWE